jgi:hypothetical protein
MGLDLPIEVRRPNMSLVAEGVAKQIFDVPEGKYIVLARLPAGQQLIAPVTVDAKGASVQLAPRKSEESPHESHETIHYFSDVQRMVANTTSVTATWTFAVANLFSPTAFGFPIVPQPEPIGVELIRYKIPGADKRQFLQISNSTTKKRVTTAIVASEGQYMDVLLPKAVTTARIEPDIKLQNSQANYLLASIRKGALRQADLASKSDVLSAERLLQQKIGDPFAACVGAYTILIMGELERLHDWTKNLQNWFTWLPDGLVIRGEHLARLGQHDEALDSFAGIPGRGVPAFSMGVVLAVNRLRQYQAMFAKDAGIIEKVESVEQFLHPTAERINPSQLVTTSVEQEYTELQPEPRAQAVAQ